LLQLQSGSKNTNNFNHYRKTRKTTPPLSEIDRNSMYGIPLKKTRGKDGMEGVVDLERAEENVYKYISPDNSPTSRSEATQQDNSFLASISSSTNLNMDGQTAAGFAPSDNNMAVGPNHIIQIINHSSGSLFKVWNKAGTVVQASTVLSGLTGLSGSGDPVVMYDQLADRWVLTEFGKTGAVTYINTLIIAVSTSGNPTGTWKVYSYNIGTFFVDYPKYAVWHNAYYATSNDFNTSGTSYLGSSIYAFDRNAMISGAPTATMIRTRLTGSGNRYYSMAPVCQEGPTVSNQSGMFAFIQDNGWVGAPQDSIFLFEFTPNFTTPASSVVGPFRAMVTVPFNTNTGSLNQQGTTQTLQSLSQRLMNKVIYRNFGGSESIVCNTTDLQNSRTGVHWWELRRPGSGPWNIYQEGLYQSSTDNNHRFMGSIAINANRDIGLLYNVTGSTAYPSARFTARNSCDPLGQMTLNETVVMNGTTYESSNNRYGDYNSLSVDPSNGSFWGTAQYNAAGYGTYGNWVTRIVNFSVSPCGAAANAGTVSGTTPLCVGQTTTYSSNGDAGGSWSSTAASVASVNSSTGFVTAIAAGTTDIVYTIGGASSSKTLVVNAGASAGTVSGPASLCINNNIMYSSDGAAGGTWSSSNTSVAIVNSSSGLVTALGAGSTNIIYSVNSACGNVFSFKNVVVSSYANAGTVSGTSPLSVTQTATFSSNGDAGGSWSSSNIAVAIVNANTGVVTALVPGTADIIYTVNTGCNAPVSASKTLTVGGGTTAGTVSGDSPLCIGQFANYSSNGDPGGVWTSSNTVVAVVDPVTGLVTALAAGTSNITYTVGGASAFKTLTVNSSASAGTVSGSSSICAGGTTVYSSNGSAGGSWSSSDNAVATVNASGIVTGVAAGTANITYTINNSCGEDASSSTITINSCAQPTVNCPSNVSGSATTTSCNVSLAIPNPSISNTTSLTWTMTGATSASSGSFGINYVGTRTFNIGVTTIVYTAAGTGGSEATCSLTVTVSDNTPASITCPANITNTQNGPNKCSATINTPNPNISANCSVSSLTWTMTGAKTASSPAAGINYVGTQSFPVGVTTVTYTVTNGAGNIASCSFTVTVKNKKCPNSPSDPLLTGAEGSNDKLRLNVYPNPSETFFTLEIGSSSTENVMISVFSINGNLVQKLNGSVFDVYRFGEHYSAGTYVVKVTQGDKQAIVKLVK
jgi:uncharacterized protein YjdB